MRGLTICSGSIRTTGFGWLLLLASLLWPSLASAAVTWSSSQFQLSGYSSLPSLCQALEPYVSDAWGQPVTYSSHEVRSTDGRCAFTTQSGGHGDVWVQKNGSTCDMPDEIYNAQTGECEAPESDPCEPTIGDIAEHRHRSGDFTGAGVVGNRSEPPGSVCKNQCQYVFNYKPVRAHRFDNGDPAGVFVTYEYVGNGVTCTANETPFIPEPETSPRNERESDCTNKVTHADGSQSYDCQATELNIDPGNMDCSVGEVNGELKCVAKSPAPSLTEKQVDKHVEEKTNPDGSKDTTTTTTTNTTTCSGVNACSTSTTTNVSNNKTNSDGTDGGSSSSCTGPGCKNGGDGSDTPIEEEGPVSSVTGDSACQATPACEGDAVQCAILRQTHKSRCDQEDFQSLEADKVTAAQVTLESEFASEGYQPLTSGSEGTFALADVLDTSSSISSSCPALPTLSFTIYGQTETFSFGDWLAELCKIAAWFGYLLVAFAMRAAAEIIARGFA